MGIIKFSWLKQGSRKIQDFSLSKLQLVTYLLMYIQYVQFSTYEYFPQESISVLVGDMSRFQIESRVANLCAKLDCQNQPESILWLVSLWRKLYLQNDNLHKPRAGFLLYQWAWFLWLCAISVSLSLFLVVIALAALARGRGLKNLLYLKRNICFDLYQNLWTILISFSRSRIIKEQGYLNAYENIWIQT